MISVGLIPGAKSLRNKLLLDKCHCSGELLLARVESTTPFFDFDFELENEPVTLILKGGSPWVGGLVITSS